MVGNPPVLVVVLNASPLISLLLKISRKFARIVRTNYNRTWYVLSNRSGYLPVRTASVSHQ